MVPLGKTNYEDTRIDGIKYGLEQLIPKPTHIIGEKSSQQYLGLESSILLYIICIITK